ncbi:membrane protein [Ligilactobacillus salitolerans]|uniref:Membrane protein n=1 Tax=Ligilactobacillus salitolerans TaxID=1808352 RepID=A0A401IV32_9LACO|nr:phage holin family protein [Ligilactobacillus salitolerans]GBG95394.1 membrane protein [Ligilactobacillus salitolerans]
MNFIKRVVINTVIFVAVAGLLPNLLHVASIWTALLAAIVLSLLNAFVKPILLILSLPITFLTLGIFYLFINAFILEMTSFFVGSTVFSFSSYGSAFLVSLIISFVNLLFTEHYSR